MRVLSLDVGVKNMSFTEVTVFKDRSACQIDDWGLIDITEGCDMDPSRLMRDINLLSQRTIELLYQKFFADRSPNNVYDCIIIENQPVIKNPTMKTLQVMIYTFFQTMRVVYGGVDDVRFVSASSKLDAVLTKQRTKTMSYKERKRISVDICRYLLSNSHFKDGDGTNAKIEMSLNANGEQLLCSTSYIVKADQKYVDLFEKSTKKDDLADALLQCMAYIFKAC